MLDRLRTVLGRDDNGRAREGPARVRLTSAAQPVDEHALARDLIRDELQTAQTAFWTRWEDDRDLEASLEALTRWHGWRTAYDRLAPPVTEELRFQVDSFVLRDCYDELFAEPETESIVFLTGLRLAPNIRTLNRCLTVEHSDQSAVRAALDADDAFATLFDLEQHDHLLLAHAHNHPGQGAGGIRPSPTDRDLQDRLEDGGCEAIGLIMTVDGNVRFFSNDLAFHPEINGSHVTSIHRDQFVFRLDEPLRTAHRAPADA